MGKSEPKDNFGRMLDLLISEAKASLSDRKVVDIIEFCESEKHLNLLGQDPPLQLWPMQRIVLKMFYRGTRGNEHLKLTGPEEDLLKEIAKSEEFDYDEALGFEQVIDKYKRGILFTHLLMVMGRRSSKTTLVSIIAVYEAYKLLETPEGNPQKYYKMAPDKSIYILNVATNEQQALYPLFAEIESRISRSPYFQDKVNHDHSRKGKLYLLTDNDKRENDERIKRGMKVLIEGSVVLMSGHSNSDSLRGHATICLLFDEFAHFKTSSGVSGGDGVYSALIPSMKQFGSDGKIILLSDPLGKDGFFWKLFQMSQKKVWDEATKTDKYPHDEILAIQLPTWRMNPTKDLSYEELSKTELPRDPTSFHTSYGARFQGVAGSKMFDPDKVETCVDYTRTESMKPDSRCIYYIHLDPATTSHNYALAMVHKETTSHNFGPPVIRVVLDKLKFWAPTSSGPINIGNVEKYIIELCQTYRVEKVTFDTFQSAQTIQNLRSRSIHSTETPYRESYLLDIYGQLKNLVNDGTLVLYPHDRLIGEMKCLLAKLVRGGFKRYYDPKSEYPGDDCVDALAGAVFQAFQKVREGGLPRSRLVMMPSVRR